MDVLEETTVAGQEREGGVRPAVREVVVRRLLGEPVAVAYEYPYITCYDSIRSTDW